MNRVFEYVKTVKWWAGLIGAVLTAVTATLAAEGVVPSWLLAITSIATAVAVWELPYQPGATAESVDSR